jgi:hypothetical protein
MRFNPPPNWPPAPPGWTPPPGWQPDPSWPPPPPGWPLWVPDAPSGRKNGLIIGSLVAVLSLVVAGVIAVVLLRSPSETSGAKSTQTSASQATDEQQIKDAVKAFEEAWNDRNFDGFKPIICKEMQSDEEFNEKDFLDARGESGELNLDVESVDITGDSATATVTREGEDQDDIDFVREDGRWKWCKL